MGLLCDRNTICKTRYEYKKLCIAEYLDEELSASTNPFAAVLMVAREALLRVKGDDRARDLALLQEKTRISMLVKERLAVFGEKKASAILLFLKNYVVFKNPEINVIFMERHDKIFQKENTMGIFEQFAEIRHEEGLQEGMERGLEKGMEKAVRVLLSSTEFSTEKIADLVGVPIGWCAK